jgi:aryl carrier-like protein
VPGELLIGGDGLARGYFKRPELTAEKFIDLPGANARFYRTGDLARYRTDGNIQCLGRLDFQVKVRGFRIELGEIETVLAAVPGIRQAVVIARPDHSGTMALVAYAVTDTGGELAVSDLRERLRRALPEYMVPQHFVKLEALPLTPNGKIDRKPLLARPIVSTETPSKVEPRTPAEKLVASLFREVLDQKLVGVDDNFFDLGGHSLMAARLMTRMRAESGHDVPLRNLFDHPTVGQLARVLDALSWSAPRQVLLQAEPGREVFEV